MKLKCVPAIFFSVAWAALALEPVDNVAPEGTDNSITNGPIKAQEAADKNIDVNSIEPQDTPDIEPADLGDEAADVSNEEFETAPTVEAIPAPDAETGDAPDLP